MCPVGFGSGNGSVPGVEAQIRLVTGSDYSGQEGWSGCRRKEIRRSADRDEADAGGRDDMVIGLDDGCRDCDRFGGRRRTSGVTGADALAAMRVTRVCRSLVVVLLIGDCRRLGRAGVQPLHHAPGDPRGEEQQSERQDSAASEERHHGQENRPRNTGAKGRK